MEARTSKYLQCIKYLAISSVCVVTLMTYANHLARKLIQNDFEKKYLNTKKSTDSILLVWGQGTGEQEQTFRFEIAAQRLGLDLRVVSSRPKNIFMSHYIKDIPLKAAMIMQPDLILTIERGIKHISIAPNFFVLDQSSDAYLYDKEGRIKLRKYDLLRFTGLLPTFPEMHLLKKGFIENGYQFFGMQWYPTVYKTTFKAQTPKNLFYPGGVLRDVTRGSKKYKEMFSQLDNYGYLQVVGKKSKWQHTPRSILKPLPFDGVSLLEAQNKAGITLILHDMEHLEGNVPSSRIFEAAAANTVIITDKLKFTQKHFGDNVLYIDVSKNSAEIASQINDHISWIYKHQAEAMQMAERCHNIFLDKFTLEQQMVELLTLSREITEHNLSSKSAGDLTDRG